MNNRFKNKTQSNLVIDAIMFLVLMAISGLGLLMKFVLIPGYKRAELYEHAADFYFLGLTRHEWGDIHLWLAFLFLFLLLLHIILHWKMIICIFRQMFSGKSMRISIASLVALAGLFLLLAPFLIQSEAGPSTRQYRHRTVPPRYMNEISYRGKSYRQRINREYSGAQRIDREITKNFQQSPSEIIRVYNYMTLNEVAEKYTISAQKLAEELNIPGTETEIKLIDLRKKYNFLLPDVRKAVLRLQQKE